MSLTSSIANLSTSTTSVNVQRLNSATMVSSGIQEDPKSGLSVANFRLPSGDARYPLTVSPKIQKTGGQKRMSIKLQSYIQVDDSVTGLSTFTPIDAILAVNAPDVLLDLADAGNLVNNLFGLFLGTVTTGSPDWKVLSNLLYGVPSLT